MKLNLGCGAQVISGWINVDYALGARLFKFPLFRWVNNKLNLFNISWNDEIFIQNLLKRLPWADNTVNIVYSSHTLEHMSKEEGLAFLKECHRVLRKGGIIRILVPDLKSVIKRYEGGVIRADDFVEDLGVLYIQKGNYLKDKMAPFIQFPHKCMYDTPTLIEILNKIGFDVKNRGFLESDIPDIKDIELESRTFNSVIVEGIKK